LWPFAAAGVIAVVTVAGLVAVWRSPRQQELVGFAGFAISVAGIAAGRIAWVWRHESSQGSGAVSGQELARLADLLAGAVEAGWTRAALERGLLEPEPIPVRWHRPAAPVAGPVSAAVTSTRFAPLPGLAAAGERRLRAGQVSELHQVYGGLGSGRLVIAGGPGSGKTSAAVLLILAALRHRRGVPEQARPEVPVPVMFTLHGWDPGIQRAGDWLADGLGQAYPLFAGRHGAGAARAMLDAGRIAVILDGLDEIPGDLRPAVLRALSQQATFRLALLTRSAEMAQAAAQALLQGAAAIELQDVDPGTAAGYLTRTQLDPPPRGWQELTSQLRRDPRSPLARALSTPLMLTLVRDTYRPGDDAGELLGLRDAAGHPASSEDITGHLLDRVLPAAYTAQPGEPPPRYDLPAAERALRRIATRMNDDGTRDLRWWHVPAWAPAAPRVIATWLGAGAVAGLANGLAYGLADGLTGGLAAGLTSGLMAGFAFGRGNKSPKRIAPVRWRHLVRRGPLAVGLLIVTVSGLMSWGFNGQAGPVAWLEDALGTGLVAWLGAGVVTGMSRPGTDNTSPLSPLSSWRSDRAFGLAAGLVVWLWVGLAGGISLGISNEQLTGLTAGLATGLLTGLLAGLVTGLLVGLVYPRSWSSSLAFAQLAASDRTPVRLMRFLEDARRRGVLRTVGPVYQFRHARLQDRLATPEPATRQGPREPRPAAGDTAAPADQLTGPWTAVRIRRPR
jgi:predicted lipid-binding transport protein (Tim44 family)